MSDGTDSPRNQDEEIETALLDAELFIKYQAPQRALKRLQTAVEQYPRSVALRERLREYAITSKQQEEAARQCLALASLYITREEFDAAHERLLEARQHDPRISITSGLEAIRRARRSEPMVSEAPAAPPPAVETRRVTFAGDLSAVSIFDVIQVLESARLTGSLTISGQDKRQQAREGRILFNTGAIVGAESERTTAQEAFSLMLEITSGSFDFQKSAQEFPVTITALSNTNLILDTLRQLDEEGQ